MPRIAKRQTQNTIKKPSTDTARQSMEVSGISSSDNPYSRGLYRELFNQGSSTYHHKADLLRAVSLTTGKSLECVGYAYAVLSSRMGKHSSNKGKSTVIADAAGKVKIIPLNRKA